MFANVSRDLNIYSNSFHHDFIHFYFFFFFLSFEGEVQEMTFLSLLSLSLFIRRNDRQAFVRRNRTIPPNEIVLRFKFPWVDR